MANNKLILEMLERAMETGSSVTAAAGFDMVVDTVVRAVKQKSDGQPSVYFDTIEAFGKYLISKKNMSCSIEMELQQEKIGGNMAIFSNCLGSLGIRTHCIGSMGYPKIEPVFAGMHENCILHSVCRTGQCNALEFNDGKVMLSSMDNLKDMTWDMICSRMDRKQLESCFGDSQLIALLNWSEMQGATALFQAVFHNCVKTGDRDRSKWLLLDLSDASRKSAGELLEILTLGEKFAEYRTTVLSMNENECRLAYQALFRREADSRRGMGQEISRALDIDYLILHLPHCAYGYTKEAVVKEDGYYTPTPRLSTGGGDNFNAGLCFGLLHGLPLAESLKLGNATSGYYVREGESPDVRQLHRFILTGSIYERRDDSTAAKDTWKQYSDSEKERTGDSHGW